MEKELMTCNICGLTIPQGTEEAGMVHMILTHPKELFASPSVQKMLGNVFRNLGAAAAARIFRK